MKIESYIIIVAEEVTYWSNKNMTFKNIKIDNYNDKIIIIKNLRRKSFWK